jgi:5-methylcytosine-specific restriction endonuclease McrA
MEIPTTKRCTKCTETKPLDAFALDRRKAGRRRADCNVCRASRARACYLIDRDHIIEAAKARSKARYAANPTARNAQARAWYAANKPKHRDLLRRWDRANPDRRKAIWHNYHARKLSAGGELTSALIAQVREMSDGMCAYCLRTDLPLTIEHVVPLSRSGTHDPNNLVMACQPCNSRKRDRGILAMLKYL